MLETVKLTKEESLFLQQNSHIKSVLEFLNGYVKRFENISVIEANDLNNIATAYLNKGNHIVVDRKYLVRVKGTRNYIVLTKEGTRLETIDAMQVGANTGKGLSKIEWQTLFKQYGIDYHIEQLLFEEV